MEYGYGMKFIMIPVIGLAFCLSSCQTGDDGKKQIDPAYAKIAADALSAALAQAITDAQADGTFGEPSK